MCVCVRERVRKGKRESLNVCHSSNNAAIIVLSTVVSRITAFIPNPTLRTHSHDGLDIIKASQPQRGHRNGKPNTTGED